MERYNKLIGKRVEAHYRVSDIELSVEGTLVSDSGTLLSIEERYTHGGRDGTMRIEIPYEFVIRVSEAHEKPQARPSILPAIPASAPKKRF